MVELRWGARAAPFRKKVARGSLTGSQMGSFWWPWGSREPNGLPNELLLVAFGLPNELVLVAFWATLWEWRGIAGNSGEWRGLAGISGESRGLAGNSGESRGIAGNSGE